MATAIFVPRINNNDDEVKLVGITVSVGDRVTKGQVIAEVETDKAVVEVEASNDGFVLEFLGSVDQVLKVGSTLAWLGQSKDESVPEARQTNDGQKVTNIAPTAKAKSLLLEHGINADHVPRSGDRLTVEDVENYIGAKVGTQSPKKVDTKSVAGEGSDMPPIAGVLQPLKSEEKGMLSTVIWHRDVAVPGYLEIAYDLEPWEQYAVAFGKLNGLLLSPLLPLMAWRLSQLAKENPRLNATIVGSKRYEYSLVNLGSTVQVGDVLYLVVVSNGAEKNELDFVNTLVDLQRKAAGHKLGPKETQGTTVGFSSMARWKVQRHIPVLSPNTSLMVAHTVGSDGVGVLGATYDHRVMSGADAASTLRKLSKPAKQAV